jgi:uncharacterized protein YcbK (DUF882 family)
MSDNRKIPENMEPVGEYFYRWEFACKGDDCCGHSAPVSKDLIYVLDDMREALGHRLRISSGFRCYKHNASEEVGSKDSSQHTKGLAADIYADGEDIDYLARVAFQSGATAVGKYTWGIHVDVREGSDKEWDYRDGI